METDQLNSQGPIPTRRASTGISILGPGFPSWDLFFCKMNGIMCSQPPRLLRTRDWSRQRAEERIQWDCGQGAPVGPEPGAIKLMLFLPLTKSKVKTASHMWRVAFQGLLGTSPISFNSNGSHMLGWMLVAFVPLHSQQCEGVKDTMVIHRWPLPQREAFNLPNPKLLDSRPYATGASPTSDTTTGPFRMYYTVRTYKPRMLVQLPQIRASDQIALRVPTLCGQHRGELIKQVFKHWGKLLAPVLSFLVIK